MFAVLLALFLVFPFIELWVATAVAGQVGGLATVLLLVGMSASGVWVLKHRGASVWRTANAELAAGRMPTKQLLDGALVFAGGMLLVIPGFITGVLGAVVLLPPVRALLRPAMLAWMTSRATRAATSGRMRGVFVNTDVGADGRIRQTTTTFGEVVDAEGWDVDVVPDALPPESIHRTGPPPGVIDVDGSDPSR